jgi:hypothetical protein
MELLRQKIATVEQAEKTGWRNRRKKENYLRVKEEI